jgi:hypothetical protein
MLSEVQSRHGDLDLRAARIAHQIAAALRYFCSTRDINYRLRLKEALSDGDRAIHSVFGSQSQQYLQEDGRAPAQVRSDYASCTAEQVAELFDGTEWRTSVAERLAARLEEMVEERLHFERLT